MGSPRFFSTPAKFRAWLEKNHETATELWVGYHRTGSGKPSITWPNSVDEALCFGWIDGVRRSVDADRYTQRFTPRRKGSHWSQINVAKVKALTTAGRMTPAGLAAYEARTARKTGRASYEQRPSAFPPSHAKAFKANKAAWAWYSKQAPWYQRTTIWYVVSAVKPETQARRLATLIAASAEGRRLIGPTGKVESTASG